MRLSLISLLAAVFLAAFLPADQPAQKGAGPGKPIAPQEAQKLFKLPPGLRIELVAAEPQIQSPVAMAFDPDGRIWVVEMLDYPNGPPQGQPPEGRIKILEDKDGDGFYETSSVFADKLLFANGLIHWKDGVIVTAAPHIVWLRDTKGQGQADKAEVLYEGFAAQNPQLRVSHPILGLDGWIYCANGLRGGKVVPADEKKKRTAEPIDLSGMDFRFNMLTGAAEAISGIGQFGNTFDDWGNRFVCDNRHHLRHVVFDNRYLKRNPFLAAPALVEDISILPDGPLNSGGKVYPLSKNWTTSSLHEGQFTAACGVHIYRGNLLPKEFRGAAFTCEPTGNLVHCEILTPHGATFRSKPHQQGVEFLATPSDWFRPVFLTSGPDGALYVIDMNRAVIEHPEWMPPELRNRPDLTLGKDTGRIWRIVPEKHQTKAIRPNLAKAKTKDLVALLENTNCWTRMTAHRLLLERGFDADVPKKELRKILEKSSSPVARHHALWLLEVLSNVFEVGVTALAKDADPHIRATVAFLVGELKTWPEEVLALASDPDPKVRFQVALALGHPKGMENSKRNAMAMAALAKIASAGADDKWTRLAVASSVGDKPGALIAEFFKARKEFDRLPLSQRSVFLQEFTALVGARQDPAEVEEFLTTLGKLEGKDAFALQLPALNGLADGVSRRGAPLASMLKKLPSTPAWLEDFAAQTRQIAANSKAESVQRLLAVRYLAHTPLAFGQDLLIPLVNDDPSQEIRLAAVRSLAAHTDRHLPALLLKSWRSYTPAVRREVVEALFRDQLRIQALLDAVEAKNVRPADLDPFRTRQLLAHGNIGIRERATKLLRDSLPADRKEVLAKYQVALLLKGDPKNGRDIFKKNCATCHRVAGIGIDVGSDIADTRTKTLDALLVDIVNPNQAIDNNYINYLVTTKNGRTLTGLLAAETASSITLKRAEGQSDVVLRQDIDIIESTGISLMPEGLEKLINIQEMADLLHFLKNWRYLDGSVPLGK